jgi:uncharacterized membrane-anchored protein YitT (DUF2179 family)
MYKERCGPPIMNKRKCRDVNLKELRKKILNQIGFYTGLVALSLVRALGAHIFIVPNGFAPGGISGLASILYNAVLPYNPQLANTWLNAGITVFFMNIPLLIWAYFKLNKSFVFNTALCVASYAGFMWLLSDIGFPVFLATDMESSFMLVASLIGGVLIGFSMGIMLILNMSMGGTDIIGKIIYQKNPVINVQWIIFLVDIVVVLSSGILGFILPPAGTHSLFVRVMSPIFYSFISLFVTSKIADVIGMGAESSVVFHIVTDKYNEIADSIVRDLHRGATILRGEGVYTHNEREILICVVRRKQIITLKKMIKEIDPKAFLYITNAREVNGFGFKAF